MRTMWRPWHFLHIAIALALPLMFTPAASGEPISLRRAVDLALSHATGASAATADQDRAYNSYREAKLAYVPQVAVGAGLGWSHGFPLSLEGSAPSLFNLTSQSVLFNPAQRDFQRAARGEWSAATVATKDQRAQVMQDTVVTYTELVKWQQQIENLRAEEVAAAKLEQSVQERIREGVDSPLDLNKAKLGTARVRLRIAEAGGSADVLRNRLAQLTGMPPGSIDVVPDSVPALPEMKQEDDLSEKAVESDFSVKAAEERERAQSFKARAEHRSLLPTADFAMQYAILARYNNYADFFKTFERHNASVGVVLRFPFFSLTQKARAEAADAEAVKARAETKAAREKVSSETLRLQRTVQQLAAAREVADLESQIAQSGFEAAQTKLDAGNGTLHEVEDARSEASVRRNALADTVLQLDRARITLLRSTGDLEKWVQSAP
jgi:outer membrane protein TolC